MELLLSGCKKGMNFFLIKRKPFIKQLSVFYNKRNEKGNN